MKPTPPLAALLVVLGTLILPAQQPPVTFRVEVNYVEIDAVVTDAQGNVVRDLTKDDFQVTEGGKAQTLASVSLVDIPVERPDAPLFAASSVEPDVRSNEREFDGRIFVLVLDDLHTHFARSGRVKAAARQFIERYLGANDLVAVVTTGSARGGSQEFTSSRSLLLRAVDAFAGRKLRSATLDKIDDYYVQRNMGTGQAPRDTNEAQRAYQARTALSTLESIAGYLGGLRGRSKAIVYFSEGIDYDVTNPIENRYATDIRDEVQQVIAEATRANVSIYGVDPRGLAGLGDELMDIASLPGDPTVNLGITALSDELRNAQDSLRVVSAETGGFAAVNRNDLRDAFTRIIADNSTYYLLGYYSDDARRDGRFRKVDVHVTRPGLTVRARRGYVAPKGKAPAKAEMGSKDTSAPLRDALASPIPVSGLGMKVFAAPLRGSAPGTSIAITVEVEGRGLTFAREGGRFSDDLEMSLLAIDQSGKIKDGARDTLELRLMPQTHDVVSEAGVRYARRLSLPPGRYQLRVGARETGAGALGTVLYDLEVPDFSKPDLAMSGLLLTSGNAAQVPSLNPDPELKTLLPQPPVAGRAFDRDDTLGLFAEVYDNQVRTPHRVAIAATVASDDGRRVFTATDEHQSEELKGGKGGYGFTASIPLADLPAGRYVLTVEARSLLSGGPAVSRQLEFRVR
jgi:VWFA-related protein